MIFIHTQRGAYLNPFAVEEFVVERDRAGEADDNKDERRFQVTARQRFPFSEPVVAITHPKAEAIMRDLLRDLIELLTSGYDQTIHIETLLKHARAAYEEADKKEEPV